MSADEWQVQATNPPSMPNPVGDVDVWLLCADQDGDGDGLP
ncbi:MAG: hypothetical protein WEB00_07400 [Dehalococcoidia bacterium]